MTIQVLSGGGGVWEYLYPAALQQNKKGSDIITLLLQ